MSAYLVATIDVKDFGAETLRIGDLNGDGAPDLGGEQSQHFFQRAPYRYDKPDCYGWGQHKPVEVTPFTWSRQVILVKDEDPMGPNYFFVRDDLTGNEKLEPAFNLWSLTKDPVMGGKPIAGDLTADAALTLAGQWGVDLDVYIAEPAPARIAVRELAHTNASVNSGRFSALHGRPFEERQELVRVYGEPGGGGFAVLVYPRGAGEPSPQFAALPGVPGVKVSLPDQTHWVIASREPVAFNEGRLSFRGTAAVVKQFAGGRVSLTLLAPGRVAFGTLSLEQREPATLEGKP